MKIAALEIETKQGYEDVIETIIETYPEQISMLGYNFTLFDMSKTTIYSESIEEAKSNEIFFREKLTSIDIEHIIKLSEIEEEQYLYAYREFLKPMPMGSVTIIPGTKSEFPEIDSGNKNNIFIAKQYAFGTGTHETTSLAIEMINKYIKEHDIKNKDTIDIGCGTGILAFVASVYGAKFVDAIDNDIQAVNCTIDNAKYNNIEMGKIAEAEAKDIIAENKKYDLIIANIETDVLVEIMGDIFSLAKDNAFIILSGILKSKFDKMKPLIEKYNYTSAENGDWLSLLLSI